jgi:amidohydrolase
MKIIDSITTQAAGIAAIRKQIHANPELCFAEVQTADLVSAKLTEWGIPMHRGMGTTGVVGIIKNGDSDRAIGLRADMDALPMQEFNTFAHASKNAGKVYLIFQPAEEGGGGAREMIKDGLFDKFPMEAVYGMHNWPGMQVGKFAVSAGPVMASSNEFKIVIHGKGGHAALPHDGVDPVLAACQMVQAFQTIISRNKKPIEAGVISVTMIHAGEATNVIPDSVEIQGTVRTFTMELLDLIEKRMREIAEHTSAAFGATCDFEFDRNYPPTINSEAEANFAGQVMSDIVGAANVLKQEPTMGAEDFSYMLLEKPGAYCFIANGEGDHRAIGHGGGPCMLHNPSYDFNDDLIPLGATFWVRLVEESLKASADGFKGMVK